MTTKKKLNVLTPDEGRVLLNMRKFAIGDSEAALVSDYLAHHLLSLSDKEYSIGVYIYNSGKKGAERIKKMFEKVGWKVELTDVCSYEIGSGDDLTTYYRLDFYISGLRE